MFSFFRRKKYADFFKKHRDLIKNSTKYSNFEDIRFVSLDTETTGFNFEKDRILCIGAVGIRNNKILVSDSFEVYVKQDVFNKETVKIHGIRRDGQEVKVSEEEAIMQFLDYLGDAVIVAHHTKFDMTMINKALRRAGGGTVRSKQLDTNFIHKKLATEDRFKKTYSLDELCDIYNVKKHDRHTALGDALITAYLFLKLTYRYKKNNVLNLEDLINTNYEL